MSKLLPLQRATVVFDLDGTIADTAGDLIQAANAALRSEGFDAAPEAAIKSGVGYGTKAMLRSALISLGREADEQTLRRMTDYLVAFYADNIALHTKLFPGFLEAANQLKSDGAKLALCTNKREYLAKKLLGELGISYLFHALAGGDSFPFHKPDPRHITEVICNAGGDPAVAVMVGDSEADIAASAAADIPSVAVTFGYAAIPAEKLGATAVISHLEELPNVVHRLIMQENIKENGRGA